MAVNTSKRFKIVWKFYGVWKNVMYIFGGYLRVCARLFVLEIQQNIKYLLGNGNFLTIRWITNIVEIISSIDHKKYWCSVSINFFLFVIGRKKIVEFSVIHFQS